MKDSQYYKKVLLEERDKLAKGLNDLGVAGPDGTWEVKDPAIDVMQADLNEVADRAEELHIDSIVLSELKTRHHNVVRALERIETNTYGICAVCNNPIEEERLDANPAAETCKAHVGDI